MERRGGTRSKGRSDAEQESQLQNLITSRLNRLTALRRNRTRTLRGRDAGLSRRRDAAEERVSNVTFQKLKRAELL